MEETTNQQEKFVSTEPLVEPLVENTIEEIETNPIIDYYESLKSMDINATMDEMETLIQTMRTSIERFHDLGNNIKNYSQLEKEKWLTEHKVRMNKIMINCKELDNLI